MAHFLDAANLLSLSRLLFAGLVWVRPEDGAFLVAVMALAAASDMLDGYVGRRLHGQRHGTANIGAWLDPFCDKVFVASVAAAVFVVYRPSLSVVALVLLRDLLLAVLIPAFRLVAGRERFHRHDFRARVSGKATTVVQFATLIAVVFAPKRAGSLAWLSALVGAVAVAEQAALVLRERPHHEGRAS